MCTDKELLERAKKLTKEFEVLLEKADNELKELKKLREKVNKK